MQKCFYLINILAFSSKFTHIRFQTLAKIFPPNETTDLCNCMFFSPKLEFKELYNRFKVHFSI